MQRETDRTGLYQLLLVACRAALALGQYRTAYHSLEAACACARSAGKWEWLDEVATTAKQLERAAPRR